MATLKDSVIDFILAILAIPSGYLLRAIRRHGIENRPMCRSVLEHIGVFPIRDHYYEPQFNYSGESTESSARNLTGIDWREEKQLSFISNLTYSKEIQDGALTSEESQGFHFGNGFFEAGDAEFWYQLIRHLKPKRIYEIGSGYSTLVAVQAIAANQSESADYSCEHICIEPFEKPWLENSNIIVLRKTIETIDLDMFRNLDAGDILFIDSSHMIRPGGDVLIEQLQILPSLNKNVVVHFHDIFSPRDYPNKWIRNKVLFWNEQYLLEAFLTHNSNWEILGALNFLHHEHHEELKRVAPYLLPSHQPGSLYIQRVS